ncbi:hypothetical protein HCA99_10325 [Listeria booriae]|uniref:hypothetical protein n=1 Tax=Listeria booriae TaxID=1552123 RepID=UPI001624FE03|nr:hypothetical protein [Listeria booriae]MBC2079606.1 hypothetical protein [Listeria booriae]
MSQGGNINPLVPMTGGGPVMGVFFLQGYPLAAAAIGVGMAILTAAVLIAKTRRKRKAI